MREAFGTSGGESTMARVLRKIRGSTFEFSAGGVFHDAQEGSQASRKSRSL